MSRPVEVEVVLSHGEHLPAVDVWLIVDVLRASTVMVRWFEIGGGDLYPTESVEAARTLAEILRLEGENPLLMGEQNAIAPQGFDLGNSPQELTHDIVRKHSCAVMATTNGTKALLKAALTGTPVLIACARNAFSALDLALSMGRRIGIFCSGRKGRPAWDDTLCAGLLTATLSEAYPDIRLADSARLALLTWRNARDFESSLKTADHAVFLDKIGYGSDIVFASKVDAARSVPELHELPVGDGMRAVLREGRKSERPLVLVAPAAQKEELPAKSENPAPAEKTVLLSPRRSAENVAGHVFFAGDNYKKQHSKSKARK